jgi:type II secretory pathway component PulK
VTNTRYNDDDRLAQIAITPNRTDRRLEPVATRGRPNRMFADTDAIRAFGAVNSAQAVDLSALVTALTSLPAASAPSMGPVGTRFLAALADAATDASRAVAALSDRLEAGHRTAGASAAAYDNADHHLGGAISRL